MSKEEVSIDREFTVHLPEHRIMFSFQNDSGAEIFHDWWEDEGRERFDAYVEENM